MFTNLTSVQPNNMEIKAIKKIEEFQSIKEDWLDLAAKQGPYMPFLSHDWFSLWLDHFINGSQLLFYMSYENGNPVLGAPFIYKKTKFRGIKVRQIELAGNAYSPFRYFLFCEGPNGLRVEHASSIFRYLVKDSLRWDVIRLDAVPEENGSFDLVKEAAAGVGLTYYEFPSYGDWYMDSINFTWEDYMAQLPKKIRKDVPYCRRRLEKMGALDFNLISEIDRVDHCMDKYYEVYSKSWQRAEKLGPTFHRDLAEVAAKNGWLRLGLLTLDGEPISAQFWITCNKTSYILKTVYDQNYGKFSPGKILTTEMMRYAIDEDKVGLIDYVQGDEGYKSDWTPKRRERKGLLIFNKNITGHFLGFLMSKVKPVIDSNESLKKGKNFLKRLLGKQTAEPSSS